MGALKYYFPGTQHGVDGLISWLDTTHDHVVQRMIVDPMLLHGRKFVMRTYVALVQNGAEQRHLRKAMHYISMIQLAAAAYDIQNLSDEVQTTNYQGSNGMSKRSMEKGAWKCDSPHKTCCNHCDAKFQVTDGFSMPGGWERLFNQTRQTMRKVIDNSFIRDGLGADNATDTKLNFRAELLAADFLVDAAGKTWLLEINREPSLMKAGQILVDYVHDFVWPGVGRHSQSDAWVDF